jgi:hypothetical protein
MAATTLRDRLYDYIRYADDKKVKAIYTMVEDEINQKHDPWEDADFLNELDVRLKAYESGEVQGSSWTEVKQRILSKKKRGA